MLYNNRMGRYPYKQRNGRTFCNWLLPATHSSSLQ